MDPLVPSCAVLRRPRLEDESAKAIHWNDAGPGGAATDEAKNAAESERFRARYSVRLPSNTTCVVANPEQLHL